MVAHILLHKIVAPHIRCKISQSKVVMPAVARSTEVIESFSKDDADVKDDVKMAWCAHLWMCHAIFTPFSRRLWRRRRVC